MTQGIDQIEREIERSEAQSEARREAEQRIQQAQDLPQYQQLGDGSYQRNFSDRQGRDVALRVKGNDAQAAARVAGERSLTSQQGIRIRAYDSAEAASPPAFKGKGEMGYANTHLEVQRDASGNVTDRRLRLNDIQTVEAYRGNGVGGEMLQEAERVGRQHGAREVYGNFTAESGQEAATRRWYEQRGYELRPGPGGGQEVHKPLARPDSDAEAVRRELRR